MKSLHDEVAKLEALIRVLCAEYAELVALFYMAQFTLNPQVRDRYESDALTTRF